MHAFVTLTANLPTSEIASVPASIEAAQSLVRTIYVGLSHAPTVGSHAVAVADVGKVVDGRATALRDGVNVVVVAAAKSVGRRPTLKARPVIKI